MDNKRLRDMVIICLFTAITCVVAPLSLPVGPVPVSLGTMMFLFSAYILGTKKALISCIVYIITGLCGLPVFSGYSGGLGKFFGPTGGYILGYLFLVVISGLAAEHFRENRKVCFMGMFAGILVCYFFGAVWLKYVGDMSFKAAVLEGVLIFLPGDIIKTVFVSLTAPILCSRLEKAGITLSSV